LSDDAFVPDEAEERWRLLFESGPLPRLIYDTATLEILAANRIAVSTYSGSIGELLGLTIADLRAPDDPDAGPTGASVHRHRRRDGSLVDVELSSQALTFDGRRAMLVTALDVTERRRLAGELIHARKMEAVGRLAGGVAHDFNNLLAVILIIAEWVGRELGADHPLRPDVDDVCAAAARASALTRQLLAFSGKKDPKPRVLTLGDVVTDVEKLLRRLIGETIALEVVLGAATPAVRTDLGHLEQVIVNLAVNARDAMPGGGRLRIETDGELLGPERAAELEVEPGPYAVLRVSDTGEGMNAETRARIFEPFFTTKARGQGTGLGLATVHELDRRPGGTVAVSSVPGGGTTFAVYLPAAQAAGPDAKQPADAAAAPRGQGTVLVVEDDEQLRAVVANALGAHGYDVLVAASGDAALASAHELARAGRRLDLLLADLVLPGEGGDATAARLREIHGGLRVVLMSGYGEDPSAGRDALSLPGTSFLVKPFTFAELAGAVRSALDARDRVPSPGR
jgi:signal transduction histidine kinase/CheY-like chemotaxis protein